MGRQIQSDKPPRSFGDLHAQQRLAPLAKFRTFRDKTQPIEVHVRATDYRDEPLSGPNQILVDNIALQTREADRASRLGY